MVEQYVFKNLATGFWFQKRGWEEKNVIPRINAFIFANILNGYWQTQDLNNR